MTVIVTSAKNRIGYNIVKSLGEKGIEVVTSDFAEPSMSFTSRYSYDHFLYPSPFEQGGNGFIECMIDNINRVQAKVLIPVLEETYLVSKFKDTLSKHVSLVVPSYEKILLAHNKDQWEPVAKSLDIKVPRTFDIEEARENLSSLQMLPFPLMIKPKQGGGGWGISQIDSWQQLEKLLQEETNGSYSWERFYLQEKIEGEIHCVAMLFNNGQLRAKVAYKQLRQYPASCGQATFRISINSPESEANLEKLLELINWHGICQADFVVDKATGVSYLIDINPRFWGSLVQGKASGVDFPFLYYKIATEGDVKPVTSFTTNIVTRWIGGDLRTFFPSLKLHRDKIKFIKEFLCPGNSQIVTDDFSFADPLPFFTWSLDILLRSLRSSSASSTVRTSLKGVWE